MVINFFKVYKKYEKIYEKKYNMLYIYVVCFIFYILQRITTWIKLKLNRSVSQNVSCVITIT
jgi:hypothetical protein